MKLSQALYIHGGRLTRSRTELAVVVKERNGSRASLDPYNVASNPPARSNEIAGWRQLPGVYFRVTDRFPIPLLATVLLSP